MIKCNSIHCVKEVEIIFEGVIIAMPCDNVKRSLLFLMLEKAAHVFVSDGVLALLFIEPGHRGLEVPGISEAVGSYWAKVWYFEMSFINLRDPTLAYLADLHRKHNPSGNDGYFSRANCQFTKLSF